MELSEQYRKIQQVGEGTFSITLPKNWVIERRLKRGDLLLITEEDDGSLRIIPPTYVEGTQSISQISNLNYSLVIFLLQYD